MKELYLKLYEKKIATQFTISIILFTLPIIYLLYFNFYAFYERYTFTEKEKIGLSLIDLALNEYKELIVANPKILSESFRNKVSDLEKTKRDFNLEEYHYRELEIINRKITYAEKEKISAEYLHPYIKFITNHSKLILDYQVNSYFLMSTLALKSPEIYKHLISEVRDEKVLDQVQTHVEDMKSSLDLVETEYSDKTPDFTNLKFCVSNLEKNLQRQLQMAIGLDRKKLASDLFECNKINSDLLSKILADRSSKQVRQSFILVFGAMILWLLAVIFNVYMCLGVSQRDDKSTT